ncbi:MAG: DUF2147 domain-containing protein [Acidobacteriaceae bacterium]|nr:DUF2147 domain-containing protein [Acidobacteriaceae bacterium]
MKVLLRVFNAFLKTLLIAAVFLVLIAASVTEASPLGIWKTIDDRTNKIRGTVEIYERQGAYFGRIASTVDPKEASEVCALCPGERKNKPIVGLVIMEGMKKNGSEYSGGEVLDPDTGTIYRGKFKLLENGKKLLLRGYVGFSLIGRTQTWIR